MKTDRFDSEAASEPAVDSQNFADSTDLSHIKELAEQLCSSDDPGVRLDAWDALVARNQIVVQLRKSVNGSRERDPSLILARCCELVQGADNRHRLEQTIGDRYGRTADASPVPDAATLINNLNGLFATASTAMAARQLARDSDADRAGLMAAAELAARSLGDRAGTPRVPCPQLLNLDGPSGVIGDIYAALEWHGWDTAAACEWTLWFLDSNVATKTRLLAVVRTPVAGVLPNGNGFVVALEAESLAASRGENSERGALIQDPWQALRPFGSTLRETMLDAWRRRFSRLAMWRLIPLDERVPEHLPLDGDSLGGAAHVAFAALKKGWPIDQDFLVLARVKGDELYSVGEELAKAKAAAKHGTTRILVGFGSRLIAGEPDHKQLLAVAPSVSVISSECDGVTERD